MDSDSILYLVATPIGNLDDISFRAVDVLKRVDLIAAEDTRHSRILLNRHGINTTITSLHEHNERSKSDRLLARLKRGESIALICDAGTPLISDPGLLLVRSAQESGIRIVPIPGPCALIVALSGSGLSPSRFSFEGFPPRNKIARRARFMELREVTSTLIFYESSHRILGCIRDIQNIFPSDREIVLARELTKIYETIIRCRISEVGHALERDPFTGKGEFVILLEGDRSYPKSEQFSAEHERVLRILLENCSLKKSTSLASEITGVRKKIIYRRALEIEREKKDRN